MKYKFVNVLQINHQLISSLLHWEKTQYMHANTGHNWNIEV